MAELSVVIAFMSWMGYLFRDDLKDIAETLNRRMVWGKSTDESHQKAVEHGDEVINAKLWNLLKDDDPAWLVAMGIEEPVVSKQEKAKQKAKAEYDRRKREQDQRDRLADLKPLTPMAWGGNTFDRDVERRLEERMQRQITPETLRDMSPAERHYARETLAQQMMGNQAAAQQALSQAEYERQRRQQQQMQGTLGSALGGMAGALVALPGIYTGIKRGN